MFKYLLKPDEASNSEKSVVLAFAYATNTCMNVILQMLIARVLDKAEVAVCMQPILVFNTIMPILQLGVANGLLFILVRNEYKVYQLMTDGLIITVISSMVAGILILCGGDEYLAVFFHNPELSSAMILMIPYMIICVPESVALVGFVYFNRLKFLAYYNAIKSLFVVLLMIVIALYIKTGFAIWVTKVICSCAFGILTVFILYSCLLERGKVRLDRKDLESILKVSLPLGIAGMAGIVSSNLDQWIIGTMFSPQEYAVFVMGAYELPIIGIITGAISTVIVVDINRAVKEGRHKDAVDLFYRIATKTSAVLMPCMVFFFFASEDLICCLFSDNYLDAVPIFCVYLLYIPIRCVVYGPMFIAYGKGNYIMFREIASLIINGIISIYLVNIIGMIGAAISTILVVYCFNVIFNIMSISKWARCVWSDLLPFKEYLNYILISLPGGIVSWIVVKNTLIVPGVETLIIKFLVFSIMTILLYYYILGLSPKKMLGR